MARFQVGCSARFNDLQHVHPKNLTQTSSTVELQAWQTKAVRRSKNNQCRWSVRSTASRGNHGGSPSWPSCEKWWLLSNLPEPSTTMAQEALHRQGVAKTAIDPLTRLLPGLLSNFTSLVINASTWATGSQRAPLMYTQGRRGMWWSDRPGESPEFQPGQRMQNTWLGRLRTSGLGHRAVAPLSPHRVTAKTHQRADPPRTHGRLWRMQPMARSLGNICSRQRPQILE